MGDIDGALTWISCDLEKESTLGIQKHSKVSFDLGIELTLALRDASGD